tara:strand:- start:388 stop:864 length:477 start_codon:yes stop_codon:yes gene_type:complete
MAISINGSTNVITGVSVGGLPDGIVDTDMLAADAVDGNKISNNLIISKFVNFNGEATGTILSSNGISSVTDLGTGYYRINFSAAFSNTNYAYAFGAMNRFSSSTTSGPTADKNEGGNIRLKHDQKATGTVEIQSSRDTNSAGEEANDVPELCVLFIGS